MNGKNHIRTGLGAGVATAAIMTTVACSNPKPEATLQGFVRRITPYADAIQAQVTEHRVTALLLTVAAVALFTFANLLPDIDQPNSILGRFWPIHGKHRTWSHAIWIPALLIFLGWKYTPWLYIVAAGWVWHVFMDSLSAAGICWFWPFQQYRTMPGGAFYAPVKFRPKLYKNGDPAESILAWVLFALGVMIAVACVFW